MKNEKDLLTSLYKNASMGTSSIAAILPRVQNPQLCQELEAQLDRYQESCRTLRQKLPKDKNFTGLHQKTSEFYAKSSIRLSTLLDSSSSHVAELMIQGTNMGVIEISKALNTDKDAPPKLKEDAAAMLKREQQYIDKLKYYL